MLPWGYTETLPSDYSDMQRVSKVGADALKAVYGKHIEDSISIACIFVIQYFSKYQPLSIFPEFHLDSPISPTIFYDFPRFKILHNRGKSRGKSVGTGENREGLTFRGGVL